MSVEVEAPPVVEVEAARSLLEGEPPTSLLFLKYREKSITPCWLSKSSSCEVNISSTKDWYFKYGNKIRARKKMVDLSFMEMYEINEHIFM